MASVTEMSVDIGFDDAVTVRFGQVQLLPEQKPLLRQMNRWVIDLCRRLPAPLRDQAVLAVQRHLPRSRADGIANFFDQYYPLSWSSLHWLADSARLEPAKALLGPALRAQAAALFLHRFDDHLVDGQIPLDNLTLQLRTQAWMSFQEDVDRLTSRIEDGPATASAMISDYLVAIHQPPQCRDLAAFDAAYRAELHTVLLTFALLAQAGGYDRHQVLAMAESAGLAWRHLDDLRDWAADARAGKLSGLYHCLPTGGQTAWRRCPGRPADAPEWRVLRSELDKLGGTAVLSPIKNHLDAAAAAATTLGLPGLARGFHAMAAPLKEVLPS